MPKRFCQSCSQKFKGRRGQLVCDKCQKQNQDKLKIMLEDEKEIKEEEIEEPDLDESGDESLV